MRPVEDFYSGLRWIGVQNANAADAPGNAVLRVTGVAPTGEYTVDQPDTDGLDGCILNGPTLIQGTGAGGVSYGLATGDTPYWALYEPTDGAPVAGETWGPGAGSWKLRKGKSGFLIYGGADGVKVEVMRSGGGAGAGPTIDVVTNVCSDVGPDNAPAVIAGGVFAKPAQVAAPGAGPGGWTPSVPASSVIKTQAFSW
jgi:hypothetical protein